MKQICALFLATAAHADTAVISGTTVTLQPSQAPGAFAEVLIQNAPHNSARDNGPIRLQMPGLNLDGAFRWNGLGDDDEVTITPPPGVVCRPTSCALVIPENESGTIWLYSTEGTGA